MIKITTGHEHNNNRSLLSSLFTGKTTKDVSNEIGAECIYINVTGIDFYFKNKSKAMMFKLQSGLTFKENNND